MDWPDAYEFHRMTMTPSRTASPSKGDPNRKERVQSLKRRSIGNSCSSREKCLVLRKNLRILREDACLQCFRFELIETGKILGSDYAKFAALLLQHDENAHKKRKTLFSHTAICGP